MEIDEKIVFYLIFTLGPILLAFYYGYKQGLLWRLEQLFEKKDK